MKIKIFTGLVVLSLVLSGCAAAKSESNVGDGC